MARGMAIVLTLLTLALALFAGWYSSQRSDYFPPELGRTFATCEHYDGALERRLVMDEFEDQWFSGELSAFREPSLYARAASAPRSLRLTWLRSFHDPVVVRIDSRGDGSAVMTARRRPGGHGFGSQGGVDREQEIVRFLSTAEAVALARIVDETGLFESPPSGCSCCLDGAQWIIEGVDPHAGYRYRSRQSPDEGLERVIGLHLLTLTGWNLEPIY